MNLLNEADIGGRNLHIFDGKIIAVYKKCYCNIPKKVENMNKKSIVNVLLVGICDCSLRFLKRVLTVTIVDTIVNGASECVFEISDYV